MSARIARQELVGKWGIGVPDDLDREARYAHQMFLGRAAGLFGMASCFSAAAVTKIRKA